MSTSSSILGSIDSTVANQVVDELPEADEYLLQDTPDLKQNRTTYHIETHKPINNLCAEYFKVYGNTMLMFVIPFILSPILIYQNTTEFQFFYVVLIMCCFWTLQPIPPQITALLPITMFPLFGILTSEEVCGAYLSSSNIMFMAGLIIAIAIEFSGLHKRIALLTVFLIGCHIRRLHVGIMLITAFLAMWVPRVGTTSMMCPIVSVVLKEFKRHDEKASIESTASQVNGPKRRNKTKICFYIGISYASSIGSMATLIGTSVSLRIYDSFLKKDTNKEDPIGFTDWLFFMFVPVIVLLIITIIWLQFVYLRLFRKTIPVDPDTSATIKEAIGLNMRSMGNLTVHEILTVVLFLAAVFLCCFRNPDSQQGWANLLQPNDPGIIKNSAPLMGIVILMFSIPKKCDCCIYCKRKVPKTAYPRHTTESMITWSYAHHKFPWQLLFFVGAGFAISDGAIKSGAAQWLGMVLQPISDLPKYPLLFVLFTIALISSNIMSGVAVSNVMVPVLMEIAGIMKLHPLFFLIPCGIATNLSFLTPIGTPTNVLVLNYASIKTVELLLAGLFPTIFSIIIFPSIYPFWGKYIFPEIFEPFAFNSSFVPASF